MRKTLCGLFLLFCVAGKSQITKGNWLVGGNFSFIQSNTKYSSPVFNQESKGFNLSISPNIGYFLVDKFSGGLRPYFSWGKGEVISSGGGTSDVKRIGIGPFLRYYFLDIEKPFNILTDVSYQVGQYNATGQKGSLSNFSANAGTVIFFNSSVGLEFLIGYSNQIEDVKSSYRNAVNGLQMTVGLQIHLEKEK